MYIIWLLYLGIDVLHYQQHTACTHTKTTRPNTEKARSRKMSIKMEMRGIDPRTSRMLSERSTI